MPVLIFIGIIGGIWAGVFFVRRKKNKSYIPNVSEKPIIKIDSKKASEPYWRETMRRLTDKRK